MRKLIVLSILTLLVPQAVIADDKPGDTDRLKRELLGSWECILPPGTPKQISHIKHITPTHYTWVTDDRERHEVLATSGGTWSLKDDKYVETCDFASDTHQHVRGKTFTFTVTVAGDKWNLKGVPGTEIDVDEVWNRIKPGEDQKKNAEAPAR